MRQKGISEEFADRVFKQILGFGEYGFPESHAASFALIAYATAYLRCHHPAVFTCSLLNAQPMGFYSAATIVDDAKRHGVRVEPIRVDQSAWDCTLEKDAGVRMGLRYVKGLPPQAGRTLVRERERAAFGSLEDFVSRVGLDVKALSALAEAGAFDGFGDSRRAALWDVRAFLREREASLSLSTQQSTPASFRPLLPLEEIAWDYRASHHSPRAHPLSVVREQLTRLGLPDARSLAELRHGTRVRYAGLVICRQRPGTASGVTFMTLEDETGFANLVLWKRVFDAQPLLARTTAFLGVTGKLQKENGVVHIVADELWEPRLPGELADSVEPKSRDFH
jgi:error-prone DNA polymerase